MTAKKSMKRTLISSLLILAMCFTMLVGTTFAWFTDSVTSANNIIKSGTLDVSLKWADGTADPDDENTEWADASQGAIFNYQLWEPGYTEVRHIAIKNEGNLALKYKVKIIANGEITDLADVIDVYYFDPAEQIADRDALADETPLGTLTAALAGMGTTATGRLAAGEDDVITIALKMQESAGNTYQDKYIGTDFSIALLATQDTVEEDSFDELYDLNAAYDEPVTVADAGELAEALSNPSVKEIILTPDTDYGTLTLDSTTDLKDVTIDAEDAQLLMDIQSGASLEGVTIKNYAPTGVTGTSDGSVTIRGGADVDITFEDSTFVPGAGWAGVRSYDQDAKLTFKDCTFEGTGSKYAVYCSSGPLAGIEFYNCTFQNFTKRLVLLNGAYTEAISLVFDKCEFKDSNCDGILKALNPFADGSNFRFTDNTLTNFTAKEGYFTTAKSDVTAPIYLTNPTFTVTVSGNTKDGVAWEPQGLILA